MLLPRAEELDGSGIPRARCEGAEVYDGHAKRSLRSWTRASVPGCWGAACHGGQSSLSLPPCCPPSLRQTAQHHWQRHLLAKMLLILHTGSPICPQVTHPTVHPHCPPHCPSQHKHHARRHRCLIAAQTFSNSAILLGLDWNKWHGEILLPPRNPQVSEQWQRDQAQLTPLGSSTREQENTEARRESEKLIRETGGPCCAHPLALVFWCWHPHYPLQAGRNSPPVGSDVSLFHHPQHLGSRGGTWTWGMG